MADGQSIGGGMNFGWMSNPALMDPGMQMAMMRQQYAQGLMNQGMDTSPIRSPWQAVARGVQGLLGGIGMNSAFDAMQDYATGSRKALAESYAQQPIPQLPQVGGQGGSAVLPAQQPGVSLMPTQTGGQMTPQGGGGGGATAPLQPAGGASGSVDPASLVPMDQARAMIEQRESGGQNVISKIPLTQDQIAKGYTDLSKGSGYFQIIPSTWAHGQQLAGIPADQRTQYAIQADRDQQIAVFNALYKESGVANWRQSPNTTYVNPNSVQPGSSSYGAIQQASQAAADYGVQMAQQYRQMAINAAQSPYAAVRALAPQYQQQSVGYLQYGRFSPVGVDQNGQIQMIDRLSGEVKTVGAPVQLHELPQGGLGTSGGQTVYGPGYSTVPGSGGVGGPGGAGGPGGGTGGPGGAGGGTTPYVGNPATSRSFGVPTSPGNPYAGLPVKDQQTAWNKDRTDASGRVDATDGEADAAKTQLLTLGRMQQIAATNPSWLGSSVGAVAARAYAEHWANDPLYQEFQTLQKSLIPAERMGAGISRVTNKDMGIFENMAPNAEMDGTALNNALQAHIRVATLTQQSNRFMHDFVNANGTDRGAQNAWDAYMRANPIFNQDPKTGVYSPNQNYTPYQDWFRAHTDPNTGQLVQPSAAPAQQPATPTNTAQNPPTHQTITTQGDALPPVGPAKTIIYDPGSGRAFMSDGTKWNPVQVPK